MTKLEGFYNEEILQEMLFKGEIGHLDYIYHHSQERKDDYKKFCSDNHLEEDESSAEKYMDWLLNQEENNHTDMLD